MMLSSFLTKLVSAMVSLYALGNPKMDYAAEEARLSTIATEIWEQTGEAGQAIPFAGPAEREVTTVAVVAVAWHESGFKPSVQDCSICKKSKDWCGGGRSVSLYQLEGPVSFGGYTKDELCKNNKAAAGRAMYMLSLYSKSGSIVAMYDGYAKGKISRPYCKAALEIADIFADLSRKTGVNVRYIYTNKTDKMRAIINE